LIAVMAQLTAINGSIIPMTKVKDTMKESQEKLFRAITGGGFRNLRRWGAVTPRMGQTWLNYKRSIINHEILGYFRETQTIEPY